MNRSRAHLGDLRRAECIGVCGVGILQGVLEGEAGDVSGSAIISLQTGELSQAGATDPGQQASNAENQVVSRQWQLMQM